MKRMIDMAADSHLFRKFYLAKPDGSEENLGRCTWTLTIPAGETMILTTTLPDDYNAHVIAFRSSLQDVKCYIDGELRTEYSTKDTRLSGKKFSQPLYILRYLFCRCRERTPHRTDDLHA